MGGALTVAVAGGCGERGDRTTEPPAVDRPAAAVACLVAAGAYVESLDVPPEEGPRAPYRELRVRMLGGTIAFVGYYEHQGDARHAARLAEERRQGSVVARGRAVAVFSGTEGAALRRCIGV